MSKGILNPHRFIRTLVVELTIYGVLLAVYFLVVLRFLGQPLTRLFDSNLPLYALAGLGLITAQGVVLDGVTSMLVRLIGLDHFD
jgi:hypothetical protein